jgi:NIPSNAP protein
MNQMNRRTLLSWLGAFAAGTVAPLSAMAGTQRQKPVGILSLETFAVANADQMPRLHAYLQGALLGVLNRIHEGPNLVLEAIVAPRLPQALLLTGFSSFAEMLDVRGRVGADSAIRQARADLESVPLLDHVQAQVLLINPESLHLPAASKPLEAGVFEIRSYHVPGCHEAPPERLGAVLKGAGIHPLLEASTAVGEHLPRFTYLIPFASLAARQDAWASLDTNPQWLSLQRECVALHGAPVKITEKSIYKLAPYSSLA